MAEQANAQASLHPLVLINVSDHYTRVKVKKNETNGRRTARIWHIIWCAKRHDS